MPALSHDDGWNIPADGPFYPPLPATYRGVQVQYVFFRCAPDSMAALLPAPLQADPAGSCVAAGLDVPFCTGYGAFQESFLLLPSLFEGSRGYYCSHVFHNGPAGIAAGREIYGTPKVYADVTFRRHEMGLVTDTAYGGVPVMRIDSTLGSPVAAKSLPALTPSWRLKVIPRADGPGPAIKQLIDGGPATSDLEVHMATRGAGRVSFQPSARCDLTGLTPTEYGPSYYVECSYTEGYAAVTYDYLAEPRDGLATR